MVLEWIAYAFTTNTISKALKIIKDKKDKINEQTLEQTLAEVLKSACGDVDVKVLRIVDEYIIEFSFPKVTVTVMATYTFDTLEIESVDIEFTNLNEEPEEVIVQ
jgi:hypothetical protein